MENQNQLQKVDFASGIIPNLHKAKVTPIDLSSEYWEPTEKNESKLGFFQKIESATYVRQETGEEIILPCVIFIEQKEDGTLKTLRNGSKLLVANIERALESGQIAEGSPLKITYTGKKKNQTNSYMSDTWAINPIKL